MSQPVSEGIIWAIFFLPLASFALIAIGHRRLPQYAGYVTIAAIGAAFVLAFITLLDVIDTGGIPIGFDSHELFTAGPLTVEVGARLDGLSGVMLVVVTGVALMVQIYSLGYMKGDTGFGRYYAFMSLFTMAMLGLILADNLLMLFVFWELV